MRWNSHSTDLAMACARVVLPTPGTSSIKRCPFDSRHTSESRRISGLPRIVSPKVRSRSASRCVAIGELSIAPAYFIYRYHSLQRFTPASLASRRFDPGLPHRPRGLLRHFQKRDVNLFAAELHSLLMAVYEDIDLVAFDGPTLVRHGVNAGIRPGPRDVNLGTHRENPGIRGDGGARNRLGTFRGHTLARVREGKELLRLSAHRTKRMLVLVAFSYRTGR
jgi:hypothetical protein